MEHNEMERNKDTIILFEYFMCNGTNFPFHRKATEQNEL